MLLAFNLNKQRLKLYSESIENQKFKLIKLLNPNNWTKCLIEMISFNKLVYELLFKISLLNEFLFTFILQEICLMFISQHTVGRKHGKYMYVHCRAKKLFILWIFYLHLYFQFKKVNVHHNEYAIYLYSKFSLIFSLHLIKILYLKSD